MSTVTITVCDMCDGQEPLTNPYHLVVDTVELDLCPQHAGRWENLASNTPATRASQAKAAAARATGEQGSQATTTTSMDIPAAPAKAAGATAKKTATAAKKRAAAKPAVRKTGKTTTAKAAKKAAARKTASAVKTSRTKATKLAGKKTSSSTKTREVLPAVDSSAVRAWARSNGIKVTERGPLKADLVKQFLAAPVNSATARGRQPVATFSHTS